MKAEPKWYVAQVLTGSEAETARRLTEAGMEAIAPVQVLHERRHGVWRLMRRTVFPGYVFVRVALIPRTYYHIQRQPQVVRLLERGRPGGGAGRGNGSRAAVRAVGPGLRRLLRGAEQRRDRDHLGAADGPAGADRKGEPKGAQGNGGADRPGRGPPDRGGARCGTGRSCASTAPAE
ncbi:MAG: transcription termination/antitermination NusG family protein [Intestinimonas sp.]